MHRDKSSDIIDIDFLNFLLLTEVKVNNTLRFLLILTFRVRVRTFAVLLVIAFNKLDSADRCISIFIDIEILRYLTLSFELSNLVGKIF